MGERERPTIGSLLVQRGRRWTDNEPMVGHRLLLSSLGLRVPTHPVNGLYQHLFFMDLRSSGWHLMTFNGIKCRYILYLHPGSSICFLSDLDLSLFCDTGLLNIPNFDSQTIIVLNLYYKYQSSVCLGQHTVLCVNLYQETKIKSLILGTIRLQQEIFCSVSRSEKLCNSAFAKEIMKVIIKIFILEW